MNFFGHALVAARRRDDPAWLVGAMTPDLAHMAGLRLRPGGEAPGAPGGPPGPGGPRGPDDAPGCAVRAPGPGAALAGDLLAAGVRLHHATDDAFHGAPAFLALLASAKADLLARGLGPGPAAALAHVGTELLLDGALAARRGVPACFRAALAQAAALGAHLPLRAPAGDPDDAQGRWRRLCERLAAAPVPEAYGDPAFVAERLVRLLAARPRLAVPPDLAPEVARWAAAARPEVAAAADALLAQVEARLAAAGHGDAAGALPVAPAQEVA